MKVRPSVKPICEKMQGYKTQGQSNGNLRKSKHKQRQG